MAAGRSSRAGRPQWRRAALCEATPRSTPSSERAPHGRDACLQGRPAALGAAAAARGNATGLDALRRAYVPGGGLADTGAARLWEFGAPLNGTLDGWLLDRWFAGPGRDDALFVRGLPDTARVRTLPGFLG